MFMPDSPYASPRFEAKFDKFTFPSIGTPIERKLLNRGPLLRIFHRLWCLLRGHCWELMSGESPKTRVEVCLRCHRADYVKGGPAKFSDIRELLNAMPLAGSMKDFFKSMYDMQKYDFTSTSFGRRRRFPEAVNCAGSNV